MVWGDRKEASIVMPHPSKVVLQDLCLALPMLSYKATLYGVFRLELFESPLFTVITVGRSGKAMGRES